MPALWGKLGADNGRGMAAAVFHQFQKVTLLCISGRSQQEFIQNNECIFLTLLHKLLVFFQYPGSFKFTEQFRETHILCFITRLAGIYTECIRDISFATASSTNKNDIQALTDILIVRQASQKFSVQMPVWQVFNVAPKGGGVCKPAFLINRLILLL